MDSLVSQPRRVELEGMITPQRLEELQDCHGNESNDLETQEWRGNLTPIEEEIVAHWDAEYAKAYEILIQMCPYGHPTGV